LFTGKGKKGGKKKATGKAKGSSQPAPAAPKQNNKAQSHTDAAHSPALTVHALTDKILEWHPDLDGAGNCVEVHFIIIIIIIIFECDLVVELNGLAGDIQAQSTVSKQCCPKL